MNSFIKRAIIGMVMGAIIGTLPGVFSAVVGGFVRADIGIQNASSVIVYLGLLIGGGSGAIIGAMHATTMIEGEADVVPVPPAK